MRLGSSLTAAHTWYGNDTVAGIFDGWAQVPFVRDRYGDNYHHRLWGKPIMLGAGGLVLWMMMSLTYVIAIITLFPDVLPPQLPPSP